MFVCWFVGLSAFYRPHDICPLCGAASEWPREQEPSWRAAPRARGRKHAQRARGRKHAQRARGRKLACTVRARARMPYNFSTKISYADAFQKQNRTRALVGADLGQLVYVYMYTNYGSIKNYNSEFHAEKQSSGSLNFLDLDNSIIS